MIRKNYYAENYSLLPSMDFDLAFLGYQNYLTEEVRAIKAKDEKRFGKQTK